jgi:hypothetical protein
MQMERRWLEAIGRVGSDWKGGKSVEGCSAPIGTEPVVLAMEADLGK